MHGLYVQILCTYVLLHARLSCIENQAENRQLCMHMRRVLLGTRKLASHPPFYPARAPFLGDQLFLAETQQTVQTALRAELGTSLFQIAQRRASMQRTDKITF